MLEPSLEQIEPPWSRLTQDFTLFAGVLLPAVSIVVELTTHICAASFFDPIPSLWHVLLVTFVPLANLQLWLAVKKKQFERGTIFGLANSISLGISSFYTVLYIPIMPLAAVFLVAGLGFLPLAPMFSLIAGIIFRRKLVQLANAAPKKSFFLKPRGLLVGIVLSTAVITVIELPATLTRVGLQMAASESPERRTQGLRWLRSVGSTEYLLRACYPRSGLATDLFGYLLSLNDPVSPEEARQIYYRLTGETFNTKVPPVRVAGRWRAQDNLDFDPDQGGTVITGKVKGLSLTASLLDGSLDADAALGYMEWTLVFKNTSEIQQEARTHVELPPGAVVSRLTLWIDGEEREAAFASRGQTRQAYQQVVSRRRDPVLVTTAGRDRVLIQCFPVPPAGGEMKIRVGITAPLLLESHSHARLLFPRFLQGNFRIPDDLNHAVWIESKSEMESASEHLQRGHPYPHIYTLRGSITNDELSRQGSSLRAARSPESTEAWSRDPFQQRVIRQSISEKTGAKRSRVILVVDTSRSMKDYSQDIAGALSSLPKSLEVKVLLASGNGQYEDTQSQQVNESNRGQLVQDIKNATFDGGADNTPALMAAWDLAAQDPAGTAIVWIHGAQLLELRSVEELRQRWLRQPDGPLLYAFQVNAGLDVVYEKLDGIPKVETVPRLSQLQFDLERLFAQLTGTVNALEQTRTIEDLAHFEATQNMKETSSHLARLWAADAISRLIEVNDNNATEAATKLAVQYQLVTPISGAVVLETQEQYRAAGLQPVDPGSVPTIPEPEMIILVAVVMVLLGIMVARQRTLRSNRRHGL